MDKNPEREVFNMKEAKVKKIIWGGVYSNPKNMLMYIMYTDMTYEE